MDENEIDLPDNLEDDEVEVVYLDDDDELPQMQDYGPCEDGHSMQEEDADEGITEEVTDMATLTFCKHKGSVFRCALSKDATLALTGGEDDMAYVWSTSTGEVVMECTGHKDSVTEVGFNQDNTLIVTADMAGLIQVWSIKEKKLMWCTEGSDIEWLQWHHASNIIITGCSSGDVYIYLVPSGKCKVLPSFGFSANCGKLLSDGKRVIVGYANGAVKLWNIKSATPDWQYTEWMDTSITSIGVNHDCTLAALLPKGRLVKMSDGKFVTTLLADGVNEIECCDFHAQLGVVATGSLSGQICIWELGKYALRHQARIEGSVTKLKFTSNGYLIIGSTDGVLYVCDARTGLLGDLLTGHTSIVLDFTVADEVGIILSASDDNTARIFHLKPDM